MPKILAEVRGDRLVLGFSMPWYDWIWWGWQWLFTVGQASQFPARYRQGLRHSRYGAQDV